VPETATSQDNLPLDASIPEVSLESNLSTEELRRRPSRPPDYEKEARALLALASAPSDSKSNILQTSADTILDVTQCDSSDLSLLTGPFASCWRRILDPLVYKKFSR
jgi:hypothetical protein